MLARIDTLHRSIPFMRTISVISAVFFIVIQPLLSASETIRLSKVSDESSPETESFHLTNAQSDQVIFVQRAAEISDDQISSVEIV